VYTPQSFATVSTRLAVVGSSVVAAREYSVRPMPVLRPFFEFERARGGKFRYLEHHIRAVDRLDTTTRATKDIQPG
jgi:hypothetical protein